MKVYKRPKKLTLGTYRELEYDAELALDGLMWYRVKDGFGSDSRHARNYQREDWVADVPEVSVSVSSSARNHGRWGPFEGYETREEAMRAEVRNHLHWIDDRIEKVETKAGLLRTAKARLQVASACLDVEA